VTISERIGGSQDFLARTVVGLTMQRRVCIYPETAQAAVLRDFIDQARDTAFGLEHGLGQVQTIEDWRAAIPIRSYDDFRPYVDRILAGETSVLTRSAPYALLKTSGTSGSPKLVPTTKHWRMHYRGPALYAQWGLYFQLLGLTKVEPWTALDLSWDRGRATRHANGLPVYGITERWESFGSTDWTPPWYGAPWFQGEMKFSQDPLDSLYVKLRYLASRAVRLVVSVNPSKLVLLAEQLRDRADDFIRDVHDGTLFGQPNAELAADRALATRLSAARRANGVLRLTDLWPRLGLLVCWMSGSARLYESWLRRLVPEVAILPFSTTGTEGIVTLPIDGHAAAGPIAVNQGVYELLPIADCDDLSMNEPAHPRELEIGGYYRLIMSQANGLFRYDVGDAYRVVGWAANVPRLEFAGRIGRYSSFTGEKLSEADVHVSVARAAGTAWADCPMFTCIPVWDTPPRYVVAMEWEDGEEARLQEFGQQVDAELQKTNIEYQSKRVSHRLGPVAVLPLRSGAFARLARHRFALGVAAAQLKHHWLQRDDAILNPIQELDLVLPSAASTPAASSPPAAPVSAAAPLEVSHAAD
jgi:hypothetical protein